MSAEPPNEDPSPPSGSEIGGAKLGARPPASLWRRPFLVLVGTRAASTLAFQVQAVAVGWQIYALTHSAFQLGMVGLAQALRLLVMIRR